MLLLRTTLPVFLMTYISLPFYLCYFVKEPVQDASASDLKELAWSFCNWHDADRTFRQ